MRISRPEICCLHLPVSMPESKPAFTAPKNDVMPMRNARVPFGPNCAITMFCQLPVQTQLRSFLLSLPERALRSATALAGGLLREVGDIAIPKTIRRGQLYRNLVEATLQFLIEQVGQVKGVYPGGEKLSEDFLIRRAA